MPKVNHRCFLVKSYLGQIVEIHFHFLLRYSGKSTVVFYHCAKPHTFLFGIEQGVFILSFG